MSSSDEWCREQFARLEIKDLQLDTLNEIKNHLTNLPPPAQEVSSNFLKLPALFECLDTSENASLACDVLSICMTNLDLGEAINNHSNLLEKSLYHQNPDVQMLALNELLKLAKHSKNMITDTNLVIASIKCLESKETRIGTICIELLIKILPNFIDIGNIKSNIDEILKSRDDIVRCRVYEIGVNLSKDPMIQEKIEFILSKLILDLNNDDILLQLNVLELLSQLALTDNGLIYLENKGVITKLIKKIDCGDQLLSQLIVPGLIKFFGNIASLHPIKIFNKYPNVITSLFDCILLNDISTIATALSTLGSISKSIDGKICLNTEMETKLCIVLIQIFNNLNTYSTDLKIRALNTLEQLFGSDTNEPNNQISSITENWYNKMTSSSNDLIFIMNFCKNPFPDIKIAGLQLLQSIINYKWGQQYLLSTPSFLEFLLDRKIEFDKNVIHIKYEIVKLLAVSKIFDNDTLNQFKKYVTEGIFYMQTIVEVAIEGAE